jgi:hypothetical protein
VISLSSLILGRPLFRTAGVERLLARQVLSPKHDVRLERAASVPKEFVSLRGFTPSITAKREMLIVPRLYLLENRRRRQAPGGLLRRSQVQAIGDDFLSDAVGANKKRILVPGARHKRIATFPSL